MQKTEMKVPDERIGALIGKDGETKKKIEQESGCRISIKDGVVSLQSEDPIGFLRAKDVIRAVGLGFNPVVAFKLFKSDFIILDVMNLDFSPNDLQRIKGRIIGKEGKIRKLIEETLGVNVSIYHKSVAVIGEIENVNATREVINMIIEGAQHSTVYKFLENKRRDIKMQKLDWKKVGGPNE